MFEKFILESLVFNLLFGKIKGRCLDLGSGAGVPGFILALINPEIELISLDKSPKKIHFQQSIKKEFKLSNFMPLSDRIEETPEGNFDFIFCRAFKSIDLTMELTKNKLNSNGKLVFWKGANWQAEWGTANKNNSTGFVLQGEHRYDISSKSGGNLLIYSRIN